MKPDMKFLDYDSRPKPRTDFYCCKCQRDLDRSKRCLWVFLTNDMYVVRPEHVKRYKGSSFGWFPIGSDCAAVLGLDWTSSTPE